MSQPTGKPIPLVVGVSHKTAPLEVREKLALGENQLQEALSFLKGHLGQGAILSTCNRTEVYCTTEHPVLGREKVVNFLSLYHHIPVEGIAPYLYTRARDEAVRHLFGVASGVDSLILGEPQILGQVRDAMEAAEATGALGTPLGDLFRHALRVGRRARQETAIGHNAISVSHAAVELACRALGEVQDRRVLVIGAGEMGKLAARALANRGVGEILVTNRTLERAQALAAELGGRAIPFEEMEEAVAGVDIVISATGASRYVLSFPLVEEALIRRGWCPIIIVDIAVPRDVDPRVRDLPGVFLYDVDDLQAVAQANQRGREGAIAHVEAIIQEEGERFIRWWDSREVVPTIVELRNLAEQMRLQELKEALGKMSNLSDRDKACVEALSRAIVNKLLHQPVVSLKKNHRNRQARKLVRDLFGLNGTE